MGKERISVIVPAYNTAPWLPRCLDSLMDQTYENLEVIVVNDGSTDDTKAVLDAYAWEHPRVRAIHKENGGVTSARLRGVKEASGSWIGFMDGDDEVEPEMYAHLLENAKASGADISHCGHQVLFPDGRVEAVHGSGVLRQQDRLTGLQDLLDGGLIESSLCTKLFCRELFGGLEAWMDPAIKNNEDYLMNYHLFSQAKKAVFEDICPYHYILRQGSASYRKLSEHSIFDPIRVRQKILASCDPALREDARRALLRNLLFAYAQLSVNAGQNVKDWRQQVRQLLKEQKLYFSLLSVRNRILAQMICTAPWSFRLAYGAYVKLFQREEQH
ncbi:MAG: glycosyltransferase family 2 protein [Faecousia sp.]